MRFRLLLSVCAVLGSTVFPPLSAQGPSNTSAIPDLSGAWRGRPLMSLSASDPGGRLRGKEPDVPYQPWALEKMLSEVPPRAPSASRIARPIPGSSTANRMALFASTRTPGERRSSEMPDRVLILHEVMQQFRIGTPE